MQHIGQRINIRLEFVLVWDLKMSLFAKLFPEQKIWISCSGEWLVTFFGGPPIPYFFLHCNYLQ